MKIHDITFPLADFTPVYEGDPRVKTETAHSIGKGDSANVTSLCCGAHTATHVDAPNHFIDGTRRVHELDLDKMIGRCRVVEIADEVDEIEPSHLGDLAGVERIIFKTRNSEFWNTPETGFRKDFTAVGTDAARVIADAGVKLVGVDYLSVEKFGSPDHATHIALLEKEVVIVEGLDLRDITPGDYELICLPLKIISGTGDGAPARAVLREL